ncbi:MAG: cysteine desulfurase-like protein [Bacteroidetes bacterium]|nr:cysteine desulfurase-like protein [Bacteroidota bacterium]
MNQHQDRATVDRIRKSFPALRRKHHGYPVAYLDGPGGTQVPSVVTDAMVNYLLHHNANTHWAFPSSSETDAILEQSRHTFANFLNCQPSEIVYGQNMTTLTFHLARTLGRTWNQNDEIIVTDLDHHANIDPWKELAGEHGFRIRSVQFNPETGQLNLDHLERLITPRTRLIAIGAASNALGTVNDIKSITRLARGASILTFVDGVAYAPHILSDVQDLGCDFFVCSPYKFYGPHAGILFGKQELLEQLNPPHLQPAGTQPPQCFETGTLSHEAIAGSAAAVNFLASLSVSSSYREALQLSYHDIHQRTHDLTAFLWQELQDIKRITCYGPNPSEPRIPTISFTMKGTSSEEICRELSRFGLFLSHGDFYASTVIEKLGVEGLIRVGISCYTNHEEIERLVGCLQEITPSTCGTL